jgi:hypothetical protein
MIISVRVRNRQYDRRHLVAYHVEIHDMYTGEILPRKSWMSGDEFCLSTGDKKFPFRVIHMDDVVDGLLHSTIRRAA